MPQPSNLLRAEYACWLPHALQIPPEQGCHLLVRLDVMMTACVKLVRMGM